jgi:hypothetical protein
MNLNRASNLNLATNLNRGASRHNDERELMSGDAPHNPLQPFERDADAMLAQHKVVSAISRATQHIGRVAFAGRHSILRSLHRQSPWEQI